MEVNMDDVSLLKVSDKKWKEAKLFFNENHLAKRYDSKNNKMYFEIDDKNNILACKKDFFGEFSVDFVDLCVSEYGHNYIHVSEDNPEANIAFKKVMKNENIAITRLECNKKEFYLLSMPPNFDKVSGTERIKKGFLKTYQEVLNMKLLHKALFSDFFNLESRNKIYRGVLASCHPESILKIIKDLIQASVTPENVQHVIYELERLLTKMILIDRHKNILQELTGYLRNLDVKDISIDILGTRQVQMYLKIMKLLSVQTHDDVNRLMILQNQLTIVAHQANTYNTKRQELIKKLDAADMGTDSTLDKIVKLDLSDNLELPTLCNFADQFAFALKNRAYRNYLNILPEDFYGLAWSKNLDDPNSNGQTLKKMVADFNYISYQATNDIMHALGYHHQSNIMIFYTLTCKKLIEIGDFNSAYAIFSGLNHVAVDRLHYLKNHNITKPILSQIESLYSVMNSMKNYKDAVKDALSKGRIVVPFMGVHLKELTFAEEGNPIILCNGNLNLDRVELLGDIYTHLDDSLAQLYRASPLKSCLSLKKIDNVILDDDKVYDLSLHCFPREIPDVSKCKTLEELAGKILIKRTLPLYLSVSSHHHIYHLPKVYHKIIDFIDERISKKDVCSSELQMALQLINKLRLHANRNHMLSEDISKQIDKINGLCVNKIQSIELIFDSSVSSHSESSSPRRHKHSK